MDFLSTVDRLLERRDWRVRLRAALKLSRHGARGTLKPVLRRLELECHPAVIAALLIALARLGTARHVVVVSAYLSHRDHRVMRAAALALYRLGGADALPLLIGLLGKQDERVVKQAIIALVLTDADTLFGHVAMLGRSPFAPVRAIGATCRAWLDDAEVRALGGVTAAQLEAAFAPRPLPAPVSRPVVAPVPNRFHAAGPRALVGLALVALIALGGPGERAGVPTLDPVARALDTAAARPLVPAPAAPRRAPPAASLAERIENLRERAVALRPRPFRLTPEVVARRAAQRLEAAGLTAPAYVELRTRAAVSDAAALALLAKVQAAEDRGDALGALALLDEALAGLHPNDLERLVHLTRQRRQLLQRHQRWADAHRALIAETYAEASVAAILEATRDRAGKPLVPAGTAAATRARASRLESLPLEKSPVMPGERRLS